MEERRAWADLLSRPLKPSATDVPCCEFLIADPELAGV